MNDQRDQKSDNVLVKARRDEHEAHDRKGDEADGARHQPGIYNP